MKGREKAQGKIVRAASIYANIQLDRKDDLVEILLKPKMNSPLLYETQPKSNNKKNVYDNSSNTKQVQLSNLIYQPPAECGEVNHLRSETAKFGSEEESKSAMRIRKQHYTPI